LSAAVVTPEGGRRASVGFWDGFSLPSGVGSVFPTWREVPALPIGSFRVGAGVGAPAVYLGSNGRRHEFGVTGAVVQPEPPQRHGFLGPALSLVGHGPPMDPDSGLSLCRPPTSLLLPLLESRLLRQPLPTSKRIAVAPSMSRSVIFPTTARAVASYTSSSAWGAAC
jgi:hypothetical protein